MSQTTEDDRNIQLPSGFGIKDVVSWGGTGVVLHDKSSKTVIKTPFDPWNELCLRQIARERQVYERLAERGGHRGLLSYHGPFESGIRLEYAANFELRLYNNRPGHADVGLAQRLRWVVQIAEALGFVHAAGVIHGDLTCANVFVDEDLDARLADFGVSSLDGSPLLGVVTESHEFPGPLLSARADLFAFGSLLYEIMTKHQPCEGWSERAIQARYARGEFPETESLGAIGAVIRKCWQAEYDGAEMLVRDMRDACISQMRLEGCAM